MLAINVKVINKIPTTSRIIILPKLKKSYKVSETLLDCNHCIYKTLDDVEEVYYCHCTGKEIATLYDDFEDIIPCENFHLSINPEWKTTDLNEELPF
jgi:hypothetical protein